VGPRHDLMTDPADSRRAIHLAGGLHPCPGLPAEDGGEALPLGADPLPGQVAPLRQNTRLPLLLVDVDANMVQGPRR
jgi:hypothetical protein